MRPYEDLTYRGGGRIIFRQLRLFWELLTSLGQIHSAKKKRTPPRDQASGWTNRARIKIFRVYRLKTAGAFGLSAEKLVFGVFAFNHLVSG